MGESPSGFCRCSWLRGQVVLLAHGAQLTAPFPYSRHRFPKFFVGDVQVALRLLDVGVAEHQLDQMDRADEIAGY